MVVSCQLFFYPSLKDFAKKGKFACKVSCSLPSALLQEQERILFYRSVRELLANAAKYSRAKNVDIAIEKVNNRIQITVIDDGIGFDCKKVLNGKNGKSGFGLFSIRERFEALGGNLKIQSEPGKGTMITLSAPMLKIYFNFYSFFTQLFANTKFGKSSNIQPFFSV